MPKGVLTNGVHRFYFVYQLLLSRAELAEQNNKVKPYTAAYVGVRDVLEHINDLRISKVPLTIKVRRT